MRRVLAALLVPEGVLLLGAAAAVRWPVVLAPVGPAVPLLPGITLVAGAVLAVRFQRSGVLLALLALAGAGAALRWTDAGGGVPIVIAILLPANLLAFALLPERGLASPAAARRAGALLGQAAVLLVLARPDQLATLAPLARQTLTAPLLPAGGPVGDLAFLTAAAALALLAILLVRRPDPLTRGFLWAVAGALLALTVGPERAVGGVTASAWLLTVAGLSLVIAVIETAYAHAYRDALTGLPSRRALDDALRRLDGPFAIAMVDIDHFKAVNDTHGHDVGDQVLRLVAGHLEGVGEGGRAFRYGGEEFAILFAGRSATDVLPALETVRESVAAARFTVRGADRPRRRPKRPQRRSGADHLAVTVSLGVTQRAGGETDPHAVITRADAALYRAKHAGRNRLEVGRAGRRA